MQSKRFQNVICFLIVIALLFSCLCYAEVRMPSSSTCKKTSSATCYQANLFKALGEFRSEETMVHGAAKAYKNENRIGESILVMILFLELLAYCLLSKTFARRCAFLKGTYTHKILLDYIHLKDGKSSPNT